MMIRAQALNVKVATGPNGAADASILRLCRQATPQPSPSRKDPQYWKPKLGLAAAIIVRRLSRSKENPRRKAGASVQAATGGVGGQHGPAPLV
jgi:hypothetical protein